MAPPASVLSRTLQSISMTKIQEIEKQRASYEERKNEVLEQADKFLNDPHKRIARLARGLLDLYPEATHDQKVKNIKYWLQQARYDASVPAEMLHSWEEVLRSKLEVQSRKLGLAHLYSQLVTEWMDPANPVGEVPEADDASFEILDRQKERLQELCDKFERVVFEPLKTDEVEIDLFMNDLFEGDEASKSLKGLRRQMQYVGESLMARKNPFDIITLKWCLRGLLAEDLLSDEKQVILRDFFENEMALKEIGDVLNMRYADFDSWQWQAGKDGIPVLPRQQLNGKYRIWMDEDVLQAIFIEFVGIQCCIKVKPILRALINDPATAWDWTTGTKPRTLDHLRREYYTNVNLSRANTVSLQRKSRYNGQFFLSQLPGSVNDLGSGTYVNDSAGSEVEGDKKVAQNTKQELLRTIATEVLLGRKISGSVVVIQSDLKWYSTGLSHNTIFAVMRFFGLPDKLIKFYRKVIEAPLNMPASDRDGPRDPKIRKRGVPMAHATEKFIGELILFVMDLVVNKETGLLLYRLHDDLFLCGEPARCAKAWKVMGLFAKVMGLEFNMHKTGSVYLTNDEGSHDPSIQSSLPSGPVEICHLVLDPKSGEWVIDQKQVQAHVAQLGKQLAACDSILSWVQTWNSCMGRFFGHTFGEPAFCLGSRHLDSILETYEQMQTVLFTNAAAPTKGDDLGSDTAEPGNVVQYLKARIEERFGVSDIPNAFIFLPEQLGGLGVRNPFIPMLVLRESLCETHNSPQDIIEAWLIDEKETYLELKKSFYELPTVEDRLRPCRAPQFTTALKVYKQEKEEELQTFFSCEEYSSTLEDTSRSMLKTYQKLIATPSLKEPDLHEDVAIALSDLGLTRDNGSIIAQQGDAKAKTSETKWALQMFRDELLDRYGGLRLVDEKFLALGVLTMMRSKAIRWNMVL
ncbi:putative Reverse transcriptase domain-containing protein [Seiridium cardinale]|uniref:Reverse transcriptase domain-containing protein n=1 Tax=Seiridium cardinale TaxID=138064 RepID=A0ABR2XNN6_9PEZI